MCDFLSFAVDIREEYFGRIYMGMPNSHGGIQRAHGLGPSDYRECEWTGNSSRTLYVRISWADGNKLKSAIKAAI